MPISMDAHTNLIKIAVAYRKSFCETRDILAKEIDKYRDDGNPYAAAAITNAVNYMTMQIEELRRIYDHHLNYALVYYTPARLKHNERMKLAQRKRRTGSYEAAPKESITDEEMIFVEDTKPALSPEILAELEKWKRNEE